MQIMATKLHQMLMFMNSEQFLLLFFFLGVGASQYHANSGGTAIYVPFQGPAPINDRIPPAALKS